MKVNLQGKDIDKLRMAIACAAVDDVRYYLNGFMLDFSDPVKGIDIVGTDGHMLSRDVLPYDSVEESPDWLDEKSNKQVIVGCSRKEKIPARAERVVIEAEAAGGSGTITCFAEAGKVLKIIPIEIIEGTYPDWNRVVPKGESSLYEIGFDATLLHRMVSAVRGKGQAITKLSFTKRGEAGIIDVTIVGYNCSDTILGIMPCRVK